MKAILLVTETKYYHIAVIKDLLGDTVIVCTYGSKRTHQKGRLNIKVNSELEIEERIKYIIQVRLRRGYKVVEE